MCVLISALLTWVIRRRKKGLPVTLPIVSDVCAAVWNHVVPCGGLCFYVLWLSVLIVYYGITKCCRRLGNGFRGSSGSRDDEDDVEQGLTLEEERELTRKHRETAKKSIQRTRDLQKALTKKANELARRNLDAELDRRLLNEWTRRLEQEKEVLDSLAAQLNASIDNLANLPPPPSQTPSSSPPNSPAPNGRSPSKNRAPESKSGRSPSKNGTLPTSVVPPPPPSSSRSTSAPTASRPSSLCPGSTNPAATPSLSTEASGVRKVIHNVCFSFFGRKSFPRLPFQTVFA